MSLLQPRFEEMTEIWYRFQEQRYSVTIDAEQEIYGTRIDIIRIDYTVIKHTPKGVWLGYGHGGWKRFVKKDATRRFACPTIEEAKVSFIARKNKQISILQKQISQIQEALKLIEKV